MGKNELKKQNNTITTLEQYGESISAYEVMSRSHLPQTLELRDYEKYFRKSFMVRYNSVKANYELAQTYVDETDGREKDEWVELVFEEIINDMNRAGAKDKGRKDVTDQELTRILKDRRMVPEFDPILTYFNGLETKYQNLQNAQGEIEKMASYITVEGGEEQQERWVENFKKALIRTVKCAINPLYFNKHCLVLFSTGQSKGKTSYLRSLSPKILSDYYYEEMIGTDKDSQIMIAKSFIVLLDELSTLSRMDINAMKSVLSKREVNVRLPYERRAQIFPRRCSFFGTTNRTDFLADRENVRWLIFDVKEIDLSYGNIYTGEFEVDIDRMWAEAYYLYKSGYNCELSREELVLNEVNNDLFTTNNTARDIIDELFVPTDYTDKDKKGYYRGQPTQIYEKAVELLNEAGRETVAKALEKNERGFYTELGRMKGWKKVSVKLDDGRTVAGYHYLVRSELDKTELF